MMSADQKTNMHRIILSGNAGSGKTTMARSLMQEKSIPCLSLDEITWTEDSERKPFTESIHEMEKFIFTYDSWIIEGCYSDLIEVALPHSTELRFLNPGIETCIENCRQRPWEPEKFSCPETQQTMLDTLIEWVRKYETRDDEYGLKRHRQIYDAFKGPKIEYVCNEIL
jgi:adenylate kinase family enzyme